MFVFRKVNVMLSTIIILAAAAALQAQTLPARPPGTTRTDLQRHDLSIRGWETLQARVDFAPGASFPKHSHPGEEIIFVLEGTIEYDVEGKGPTTLRAGDVLFVPPGVFHGARNPGESTAAELATYVLEKGKPLVTLQK
jgi:quercetin dioxygenase-like cupin family protein